MSVSQWRLFYFVGAVVLTMCLHELRTIYMTFSTVYWWLNFLRWLGKVPSDSEDRQWTSTR